MLPSEWPLEWFSWHGLMSAVGLLVYVLGSHALGQRRHPSAAIAWVMLILLLPELGVPLYLLFGTRKLPKAERITPGDRPPADAAGPLGEHQVPAWVLRLTASMNLPPPCGYQALVIHQDGRQAAMALHRIIDAARHRLDVCAFLLGRDAFGEMLLQALIRARSRGVAVRLLVDGVGTWMGGRRDFAIARQAGVQVARFAPPMRSPMIWPLRGRTNLRNHRKLVVADGRCLWSGGRNLGGEYFEGVADRPAWIDLSFDLEGELAHEAALMFDGDWAFAQGEAMLPRQPAPHAGTPATGEDRRYAQLLPSGPDHADDTVHALLLTACFRARNRILVATPYLVPDESLLGALCLAARRGVAVDLLLPAHSNHRLADIARQRPMRDLAEAGARLWLHPGMIHAKAMVFDEHMALAGSANLDSRSLFLNYELMTGFYHAADISRFADWIETQRSFASAFEPRAPGLARSVAEGLVLWLAFQL